MLKKNETCPKAGNTTTHYGPPGSSSSSSSMHSGTGSSLVLGCGALPVELDPGTDPVDRYVVIILTYL